jgi:hypothetical protein
LATRGGRLVNGKEPRLFLAFHHITSIKDNDQMHLQRKINTHNLVIT